MRLGYFSGKIKGVVNRKLIKIVRRAKKSTPKYNVNFVYNDRISFPELILIDDQGNNLGKVSRDEALRMAREKELDLILVSDNAANPVAKIEELSKAKYEKIKKLKKNAKGKSEQKEWWFYPNIQERDMEIRLEKIKEFVLKGQGTAKLTLKARGKTSPLLMQETMAKMKEKSVEFAKIVTDITREGRNLSIIIRSN